MLSVMSNQWIISFGEFLDRFSYYGFLSIYILLAMSFSASSSSAIKEYGLYATFGFSLPTILGYFSDKWNQHYQVTIVGLLFFAASFFLMALYDTGASFIISATLVLLAIGCFKSNNLKIFIDHNDHPGKFNIYYALMTGGAVLGPLLFGYYYNLKNLTSPMLIAAFVSLVTFSVYVIRFNKSLMSDLKQIKKAIMMFGIMALLFFVILGSYYYDSIYDMYILSLIGMVFIIVKKINDFALIKKLMVLLLFSTLFFTTEVLISGILLLYVKNNIGEHFYSLYIPLPYFTMIFSVVSILSALCFSRYLMTLENRLFNFHYYKLLLGGIFGAISMFLIFLSHRSNVNLGLLIVLISLFFIGVADFLITPSILSYLAQFSSEKIKSALYSLWFMSISLSAYISMKLFNLGVLISSPKNSVDHYLMTFLLAGLLLIFILPLMTLLKFKSPLKILCLDPSIESRGDEERSS